MVDSNINNRQNLFRLVRFHHLTPRGPLGLLHLPDPQDLSRLCQLNLYLLDLLDQLRRHQLRLLDRYNQLHPQNL